MTYYVDGDNLMHDIFDVPDGPARDSVREQLVTKLSIGRNNLGSRIVVVFDAKGGPRSTETRNGVTVEYPAAIADDRLVQLAGNRSKGVFVTNDRELRARIVHEGKQVISNSEFKEKLEPSRPTRKRRKKPDKASDKRAMSGSRDDAKLFGLDPDDTIEI